MSNGLVLLEWCSKSKKGLGGSVLRIKEQKLLYQRFVTTPNWHFVKVSRRSLPSGSRTSYVNRASFFLSWHDSLVVHDEHCQVTFLSKSMFSSPICNNSIAFDQSPTALRSSLEVFPTNRFVSPSSLHLEKSLRVLAFNLPLLLYLRDHLF